MRSRRPYLLRAMYEWMADTSQTPYVLVDARQDGVQVPQGSVHEGRIVLNIGMSAAHQLTLGNDVVEFDARFNGVSHHVVVPVGAVLAIYARETGQGMMFGLEDEGPVEGAAAAATVVTVDLEGKSGLQHEEPFSEKQYSEKPTEAPKTKGRPNLKVVK